MLKTAGGSPERKLRCPVARSEVRGEQIRPQQYPMDGEFDFQ